jgi:hypothetical protein
MIHGNDVYLLLDPSQSLTGKEGSPDGLIWARKLEHSTLHAWVYMWDNTSYSIVRCLDGGSQFFSSSRNSLGDTVPAPGTTRCPVPR